MAKVYQKSRALLWRLQFHYLRHKAKYYLAISEFTKSEMHEILGIPKESIWVVPCAAAETMKRVDDGMQLQKVREKYHLPENYVLFVGNFNPRKNLERLIKAFDRMKKENKFPHHLVIAGGQGWKFSKEDALKNIENSDAIDFLEFVEDEDMPALYSMAEVFAFPTLYEGFGIPIIEAQLCGVPVLCSNTSSMPEVGGEGAAYVDPYKVEEIAVGIQKILSDPIYQKQLTEKGYENAKRFSWKKSAQEVNWILEENIIE